MSNLERKCARKSVTEHLCEANTSLMKKQSALEQMVAAKMDRAELPLAEALASRIEELGDNLEETSQKLETVSEEVYHTILLSIFA